VFLWVKGGWYCFIHSHGSCLSVVIGISGIGIIGHLHVIMDEMVCFEFRSFYIDTDVMMAYLKTLKSMLCGISCIVNFS
jgi:hypothetical protein